MLRLKDGRVQADGQPCWGAWVAFYGYRFLISFVSLISCLHQPVLLHYLKHIPVKIPFHFGKVSESFGVFVRLIQHFVVDKVNNFLALFVEPLSDIIFVLIGISLVFLESLISFDSLQSAPHSPKGLKQILASHKNECPLLG